MIGLNKVIEECVSCCCFFARRKSCASHQGAQYSNNNNSSSNSVNITSKVVVEVCAGIVNALDSFQNGKWTNLDKIFFNKSWNDDHAGDGGMSIHLYAHTCSQYLMYLPSERILPNFTSKFHNNNAILFSK